MMSADCERMVWVGLKVTFSPQSKHTFCCYGETAMGALPLSSSLEPTGWLVPLIRLTSEKLVPPTW